MPESLKKLIDLIGFLPGIGEKTATKLALFLLRAHPAYAENLGSAIARLQSELHECERCHSVCDRNEMRCSICRDEARERTTLCVVEDYLDLVAIERLGIFSGSYHVLGGAISPANGVMTDDLHIDTLLRRVSSEPIEELILATNANLEGEATALYIEENLPKDRDLRISRLSRGLPNAGYIEYADDVTLVSAFKGRR
ncbi:MAG TPA: recombination mediator RecR [bacterium]|nr:recombination mediator RecR [bacterium]